MSKADEPPGGDPEEARKRAEAVLRQRAFGRELRSIYNQYADEAVPPSFNDLLDRLEREDPPVPPPEQEPKDDRSGRSDR